MGANNYKGVQFVIPKKKSFKNNNNSIIIKVELEGNEWSIFLLRCAHEWNVYFIYG